MLILISCLMFLFDIKKLALTFIFFLIFQQIVSTPMCLIDAEDYSDLPVRQYEEDNVLRELNKAYLGFRQHYQDAGTNVVSSSSSQQAAMHQRLLPVGASRDSSPSSRQASTTTGGIVTWIACHDDLVIIPHSRPHQESRMDGLDS